MAKKKPTSRAAAPTAAQKKSPARKTAAKSTSRKPIKTRARTQSSAKRARPKQRVAISHYRDEDFLTNGLRTYAHPAIRRKSQNCTSTMSSFRWSMS